MKLFLKKHGFLCYYELMALDDLFALLHLIKGHENKPETAPKNLGKDSDERDSDDIGAR